MADVDTSSYPKATLPTGPLDMVQKLGGIQQQKLSIDQAKLDQANQALGYMVRAMGSLGPNASKDDYAKAAQNAVDQGLVPQQQENVFLQHLQAAPDSPTFYKQFMSSAQEGFKQIEMHTGFNSEKTNGATQYQGKTNPLTGGFTPATQMPVQLPPTTPVYDNNNQQVYQGPSGPAGVQPASPTRAPAQKQPTLPVQPPKPVTTGPTGPTVDRTPETPTTFDNRFAGAFQGSTKAGPSPLFEEGKKALTEDQTMAAGRMSAVKPAIQALKLMPGLRTGPGTGQFNDLLAFAKAWGITDTKAENDPTVLRQELEKKLAQYVGNSPIASRSDAAQVLAEAGSPNPKKQILPALINLTRDSVILDRVQAARPNAFEGNVAEYGKHRATFPQSVDERAFGLDLMPADESKKLVDTMHSKYKKNPNDPTALKFFKSLDIAKKQGFFNQGSE